MSSLESGIRARLVDRRHVIEDVSEFSGLHLSLKHSLISGAQVNPLHLQDRRCSITRVGGKLAGIESTCWRLYIAYNNTCYSPMLRAGGKVSKASKNRVSNSFRLM